MGFDPLLAHFCDDLMDASAPPVGGNGDDEDPNRKKPDTLSKVKGMSHKILKRKRKNKRLVQIRHSLVLKRKHKTK